MARPFCFIFFFLNIRPVSTLKRGLLSLFLLVGLNCLLQFDFVEEFVDGSLPITVSSITEKNICGSTLSVLAYDHESVNSEGPALGQAPLSNLKDSLGDIPLGQSFTDKQIKPVFNRFIAQPRAGSLQIYRGRAPPLA